MDRGIDLCKGIALGLVGLGLVACGIGGPGENNNNNLVRPDAAVDAQVPSDGGNNNNNTGVRPLTVEELRQDFLYETLGQSIVDLREASHCHSAHIPKAYCVPESELWDGTGFLSSAGALYAVITTEANPVIFYSTADRASTVEDIAEATLGLGFSEVYVIEGGIEAWRQKGWYEDISRQGIQNLYYTSDASDMPIPDGVYIVDTMDALTYAQTNPATPGVGGHIKCALNIDGDDLWYGGVLKDGAAALLGAVALPVASPVFIFYCINAGCASSEAASFAAEALGYPTVLHYKEGLEDWQGSGRLVVTGTSPCGD